MGVDKTRLVLNLAVVTVLTVLMGGRVTLALNYCAPDKSTGSATGIAKSCKNFTGDPVACTVEVDRLSCLDKLLSSEVDFMIVEPEDLAYLGNSSSGQQLVVTHELLMSGENRPELDVEMIAVVKTHILDDFTTIDITGRKLCYLGLEDTEPERQSTFHFYYNWYFEKKVIDKPGCDKSKSHIENRVADLSRYFNAACVPGPWVPDSQLDTKLKSKYKNLCVICGNPSQCRSYSGEYGTIICLKNGGGDIAWLNKNEVEEYLDELVDLDFKLLCPDKTVRPLENIIKNDSCTWIVDPRPVIVANRRSSQKLAEVLNNTNIDPKLHALLDESYKFARTKFLDNLQSPTVYREQLTGFTDFTRPGPPDCPKLRTIRWCVSSLQEFKKCRKVQVAAKILGLRPDFECVQNVNVAETLGGIDGWSCDVAVIKAEDKNRENVRKVRTILELYSSDNEDDAAVAAMVKQSSNYSRFEDLRNAKACFTGYESVDWNTVFDILRSSSDEVDCSSTQAISQFFGSSCVHGLAGNNSQEFPQNLRALCRDYGNLNDEQSTFQCLIDGGDVAFVNVSAAKIYATPTYVFHSTFKTICLENETLSSTGLCYLTKVNLGSIVTNPNLDDATRQDVLLLFLQLDRHFGHYFDRETPLVQMYRNDEDVIFPRNTRLMMKRNRHPKPYDEILENLKQKVPCGEKPDESEGSNWGSYLMWGFIVLVIIVLVVVIVNFRDRRRLYEAIAGRIRG